MGWKTWVGFVGLFTAIVAFGALYGYFFDSQPVSGLPAKSERCVRCGNSKVIETRTGKWWCIQCQGPIRSGGDDDVDEPARASTARSEN